MGRHRIARADGPRRRPSGRIGVCQPDAGSVKERHVDLTIRVVSDLSSVDPAAWDDLDHGGSPFLEHGFLRALERSGSIGERAGWEPYYLLAEAAGPTTGQAGPPGVAPAKLVGAVAAFVKDHSYGEYIFDFGWARAAMQAGVPYYPKLVVAAPVTPATGPRILLSPALVPHTRRRVAAGLAAAVRELAVQLDLSSVHWLFCTESEHELLAELDFLPRASFQFHFENPGYADFDAFVATLKARKRKQILKERRRALEAVDGPVQMLPGDRLERADLAVLDRLYRRTVRAHGGTDYLRPGFFEALAELSPHRMRFARVIQGGETIAGALYLQSDSILFGRYWGCLREVPFLHFEVAYYAGIEHTIREKLSKFEAGAQGEHKLLRGFSPSPTYSNHWIRHPGLRGAIRRFLAEEARALPDYMRELAVFAPFKKDG
jgi:predicted N-acyltransferase